MAKYCKLGIGALGYIFRGGWNDGLTHLVLPRLYTQKSKNGHYNESQVLHISVKN